MIEGTKEHIVGHDWEIYYHPMVYSKDNYLHCAHPLCKGRHIGQVLKLRSQLQ